ncbi:helix-turn-helix domain-containing protein [Achromobacter aloeverae]|uniref:helix-turn-helix domain-containing protein n=1 Tax=Achromobacter aloeverae TaxID=1750518 RepID=UPI00100EA763|nr:helix-turn-helix domain-containing protein [Achromobacter aloeverae]
MIPSTTRELQATLQQLDADLRKLTSTVHALLNCLPGVPADSAVTPLPVLRQAPIRALAATADDTTAISMTMPTVVADQAGEQWRLRDGGWTLVSPRGQRLVLTTLERKFMLALFGAPSRSLARAELSALAPSTGESGEHPASSPRGVDVMVSRLRRKAQAMGMPLPLRSVRRWGYMFTEAALVD